MADRIRKILFFSVLCCLTAVLPSFSQDDLTDDFDSLFGDIETETKDKKEKEEKKEESGELVFEEVSFDKLDFIEDDGVEDQMFDDEFRAEAATYGFLVNHANTKLSAVSISLGTSLAETYGMLTRGFAEKGYYDLSSFREDDVVTRDIFSEFIFSIVSKKEGLNSSDYPNRISWAVTRGFLSPAGDEDIFDLPDFGSRTGEKKEDIPLIGSEEEDLFKNKPSGEQNIPDVIHPNRIAGTVDVESNITVKFVTPFSTVGAYRILKKDSAEDTYSEAGKVSGAETTFVDRDTLSSYKKGRDIVQYQISRTDNDFVVNVTYKEPSGITSTRKIYYRIEPIKDSVSKNKKASAGEEPLLPEYISGKVDFTGNIFLKWINGDDAEGKYNVYWKKGYQGTFRLLKEDISGTEFADTVNRAESGIGNISEYRISRTLDNFIMNITYTDGSGRKQTAKYFYRVAKKVWKEKTEKNVPRNFVTRGEVIDAFSTIIRDQPYLRRKLIEIPVFSPLHTLPASPI